MAHTRDALGAFARTVCVLAAMMVLCTIVEGDARAMCAMPAPVPMRILSALDRVPRGGAIVVDVGSSVTSARPRLVFARGRPREWALDTETLSARIVAVRVPADAPLGRATLTGVLATSVAVVIVDEPLAPPIDRAPAVVLRRVEDPHGQRTFEAHWIDMPPPHALALVAAWNDVRTSAVVEPRYAGAVLGWGGHCWSRGALAPRGQRVEVHWIDTAGRVSPSVTLVVE